MLICVCLQFSVSSDESGYFDLCDGRQITVSIGTRKQAFTSLERAPVCHFMETMITTICRGFGTRGQG